MVPHVNRNVGSELPAASDNNTLDVLKLGLQVKK